MGVGFRSWAVLTAAKPVSCFLGGSNYADARAHDGVQKSNRCLGHIIQHDGRKSKGTECSLLEEVRT